MDRNQEIVRTSILGIIVNVMLAGFKVMVGFLSGSIAIILDAVNNVSDAFSSIITIISTKLAAKKPDYKHPYGYGRIEYLSALVISLIIVYHFICGGNQEYLRTKYTRVYNSWISYYFCGCIS